MFSCTGCQKTAAKLDTTKREHAVNYITLQLRIIYKHITLQLCVYMYSVQPPIIAIRWSTGSVVAVDGGISLHQTMPILATPTSIIAN